MLLVSLDGEGPLYTQIYRGLRERILAGELECGLRLPPSRRLAEELGVSRNVAVTAYEQLVAEGYLDSRIGSGTYVAATLPERPSARAMVPDEAGPAPAPPRLSTFGAAARDLLHHDPRPGGAVSSPGHDFRYGRVSPDSTGLRDWMRILGREAPRADLDYGPAAGESGLREQVASYLARNRGVRCDAEQVLIVSGSQQALDLTARIMLEPGDPVVLEDPHYLGARQVFAAAGAKLRPVAVDEDGLSVASMEDVSARLVYVTPSHQFPTGAVMPVSRRLALLEWASRHAAYVIEDDYDSEFRYQGRPIEAVQGLDREQRTIYVGTFSKVLAPALRIGYLVLPTQLVETFRAAKWLCDRHTGRIEQRVAAEFIRSGSFEQHLRRMRQVNGRRREAVLGAVERHLGDAVRLVGTNAGLHMLMWVEGMHREAVAGLERRARAVDVGVYSVSDLYLHPPPQLGLLIGYGNLDEPVIEEGIRRLAKVLREQDPVTGVT